MFYALFSSFSHLIAALTSLSGRDTAHHEAPIESHESHLAQVLSERRDVRNDVVIVVEAGVARHLRRKAEMPYIYTIYDIKSICFLRVLKSYIIENMSRPHT